VLWTPIIYLSILTLIIKYQINNNNRFYASTWFIEIWLCFCLPKKKSKYSIGTLYYESMGHINALLSGWRHLLSLSTQYGATLSRHPAKSGEQRRLSMAIALHINARTYRSRYFTLDNRRLCIMCTTARPWNTLTPSVQSCESLAICRRRLKTELFSRSFPD